MIKNKKIFIDPSSKIIYSSYYIKGLYEFFGEKNVCFSSKYFSDLNKIKDDYSYDAYMAFVIKIDKELHKVIIDFGDDYPIRKNAYKWCDVYAKINYNLEKTDDIYKAKILSIAPSFGIKIWNLYEILIYSISNLSKLKFKPQSSLLNYFRSYFGQLKALKLQNFTNVNKKSKVKNNYVFFIASLWPHQNCITGTNLYRKNFMQTCLKRGVDFEGGFLVTDLFHPQFQDFKELTINRRIPLVEYVEKTKRSSFVFNTPAVHNCHGWKLGQFLAMNKAIVSTAFQNSLPEDLMHGENIHFVKEEHELDTAIVMIANNEEYRIKLEKGAAEYYEKYVAPASIIKEICQKLKIERNA